jgi:hypothetical protein
MHLASPRVLHSLRPTHWLRIWYVFLFPDFLGILGGFGAAGDALQATAHSLTNSVFVGDALQANSPQPHELRVRSSSLPMKTAFLKTDPWPLSPRTFGSTESIKII